MSSVRMFVASLVLALSLAGCASSDAPPTVGAGDGSQAQEAAEAPAKAIQAMTPTQVRSEIAEDFPLEVPVPSGVVTRGGSQGGDAWEYAVVVPASPVALADWYRTVLASRSWEVVSDTVSGTADGGSPKTTRHEITFRKGAAESRVTVSAAGEEARAIVILGVGAPVLQTQ